MNRNSTISKGSFANAGNRKPRWRNVFIALLIVLVSGSAGQTPMAQAAPAGAADINFELSIYPEKLPRICVNKEFTLYAGVSKSVYKEIGGKVWDLPGRAPNPIVTGKKVSGVGTLEKVGGSGNNGDELSSLQGDNVFIFKSDKPGTAKLRFSVPIQNSWIGANEEVIGSSVQREKEITINVIPCKFKVNTVTKFQVGMTSVGIMDAEIESDDNGSFTGTATVNWVTSIICGIVSPIDPGQADLTGTIDESGQLVGEITFEPMTSVGGGPCGIGSITTSNFGTLTPLTIKASSEGVSVYTQAQVVTAKNGSFTGTATIVVIPEEDEAVSFLPNDHQAGWRVFLSLFGALLDLR